MPLPTTLPEQKAALLEILKKRSVRRGDFVLSSGAKSDLYVNCKMTALDPAGAVLIGAIGWELVRQTAADLGVTVNAIGGLTMGADPISLSIGIAARQADESTTLQTFTVRKATKEYGAQKRIEGNFAAEDLVVVVDDVVTTGGSTIQAIEAVEAGGGKVAFVLVLVDRQEGGRANIEARGLRVVSFFTRADVLG